jgi:hypothetical protein
MPVIGVSDVWKMFEWLHKERDASRVQRKAAVIEWLEAVNKDLIQLSDLWSRMSNAGESDAALRGHRIIEGYYFSLQSNAASRLRAFYQSATLVIGGKVEERFQSNFMNALGALLLERDKARCSLDQQSNVLLLDSDATAESLRTIRSASAALQNEVASLQVLIANFKASG